MKKLVFAALSLLLLNAVPALAVEPAEELVPGTLVAQAPAAPPPPMLVAPVMNWTGFYVDLTGGGTFGHSRQTDTAGTTSGTYHQGGGIIGGGGGYNWQFDNGLVLGAEVDMSYTNLSGSNTAAGCTGATGGIPSCFTQLNWLNTDRIRLGYSWGNFLPFVAVGAAVGEVKAGQGNCGTLPGAVAACGTQTHVGWTVGGGLEGALNPNWSLKAEYLYADLGSATQYTVIIPVRVSERVNVVRVGLAYHFAAPAPVPAPAEMPAPPPVGAKVFIVFFDWDKDTITPEGHAIIQQAADAYKAGAPVQIQVTGYTDRSGSPGYNQRLSERRANNVARALAALGVPKSQMAVSGRGENDNRVPTAPGVREPQNRRVEIVSP